VAVVVEVADAVPGARELLDQRVHGFGGPVGQAGAVPPRISSPGDGRWRQA
jgi:hypothetical protein